MRAKQLKIVVAVVCGCTAAGGLVYGSPFTLKRAPSIERMRDDYCATQVTLLKEVTNLVADVAAAQEAMIGDMQAFVEGDGAPCAKASKEQLADATQKTQKMAEDIAQMRLKLRGYAGQTRLFAASA